jgi:hypothetical protein
MNSNMSILLPLLLFGLLSNRPCQTHDEVVVAKKSADLVEPILDEMNQAVQKKPMDESERSPLWRSGELLGRLFKDKSPAADEASIVLFSYYLGESSGEDLIHEVTARGPRMLPYLRKYECHNAKLQDRQYPNSLYLPPQVKQTFFQEAIRSIGKGKNSNVQ